MTGFVLSHRYPFIGLVIAACVGIVAAERWSPAYLATACLLIGFPTASLIAFCWPRLLFSYSIVAAGFFALHTLRTNDTCGLRLAQELGERPRRVNVAGCVADEPKPGRNGFATFSFQLKTVDFGGRRQSTSAVWLVRWRGEAKLGDELQLNGVAESIEPPRNPGEFDMRAYLNRRDIRRQLFVRYAEDGILIRHHAGNLILRAAQHSRDWIQRVICRSLADSPDVQTFLSGIALGVRHETSDDIEEPFQQTGTLHLFAVAGLHVGIVASLLWIVATVAQVPKKWAAAVIIPLVLFYAAITGLHVSSVRASLMTSILLGGLFFERRVFAFNSLAAAAFVLIARDTNELFSTGFQLSFAVVGTIVAMTDPLISFGQRLTAPDPFLPRTLLSRARRFTVTCANWIIHGGAVSLAAWFGSLLLVLWYFHLITPISLSANLIVVPIAFFILAIALLSIVAAPISSSLSILFNNANWFLAKAVLAIVQWFAQVPASHYYLGSQQFPGHPEQRITVLDMGTGAVCHLHVPGADWLFDCGSQRDFNRVLRDYLHAAGVNRVTGILLTHGDSLHIGGAGPLITEFPPGVLIDNPAPDRSAVHRRLLRQFQQLKIESRRLAANTVFDLGGSVSAKILFPPPIWSAPSTDDQTLVVQVSFPPSTKVLFVSDSGLATEDALISSKIDLHSDILIKGQHHSGKSGSDRFLDAVRPKLIIATSRDFPMAERIDDAWAEMVRARGIKLFRQDETGAIQIGLHKDSWTARAYVTGEIFRSESR